MMLMGLLVLALVGCSARAPVLRQAIPADVPPGTQFLAFESDPDWDVEATLRLLHDPKNPEDGIAAVMVLLTTRSDGVRRNVQVAIWLPEDLRYITPATLIGSNLLSPEPTILTPQQPSTGYLTQFEFKDFAGRQRIVDAFQGSTRVKVMWEGSAPRYLQFPGSAWHVEGG